VKVVVGAWLSSKSGRRYVVIDEATGAVLDDAIGAECLRDEWCSLRIDHYAAHLTTAVGRVTDVRRQLTR
jgi:hypothetical protein